ncbi:restriction endonuclease subunit S, partial [Planktothrix sp.]
NVEGWQIKRLEEIGVIFSGSTPSTSKPSFWDGNIVWVTPNDLSQLNTPYLYNSGKKITEQGLKNCSAQILPPNSIIISSRAPIGYIAINRVECCTNQGCKSFQLRREYNPEFVYYNLHFNINKIKMLGEGTTFAEISKTALAKVEIPFLENYEEQEQIAAVLSTIDRAIEQTEAIIAKQQRIKTGLMQDLLTKGIDENGNIRSEETH